METIKDIFLENMTRQPDYYSCGVYAAASALTLCLGKNPSTINYSKKWKIIRLHFAEIISKKHVLPFPTEEDPEEMMIDDLGEFIDINLYDKVKEEITTKEKNI